MYRLIKNFVAANELERVIDEVFDYKKAFYTPENLKTHAAYLADTKPNRTSHAYAIAPFTREDYEKLQEVTDEMMDVEFYDGPLPVLPMGDWNECGNDCLVELGLQVTQELGLSSGNRVLFNVQEYYGGSEAVPMHNDGELLDFTVEGDTLTIKKSIRPDEVAVLTLVNDTDSVARESFFQSGPGAFGGTRLHYKDGTSEVVRAEAGDLLIFKNSEVKHSVDPLSGTVKRADGLLRMTIGWRSLGEKCFYEDHDGMLPVDRAQAEAITLKWYQNEWPTKWAAIEEASSKAAF